MAKDGDPVNPLGGVHEMKSPNGSKSRNPKGRFTLSLPPKQRRAVEEEAAISGISEAEVLRLIIHQWMRGKLS